MILTPPTETDTIKARWWSLGLAIAFAAPAGSQFLRTIFATLMVPFDLEHLESPIVLTICAIKSGLSPYPDALSSRAVFLYSPLFYWIAAPLTDCAGGNPFVGARVLELGSYVGCLVGLTKLTSTSRPSRHWFWTSLVIIFAMTLSQFGVLGQWYFLARVDMLATAFSIWSWVAIKGRTKGPMPLLRAGVLLALAIGTKQSYLLQLPAMTFVLCVPLITKHARWADVREQLTLLVAPCVILFAGLVAGGGLSAFDFMFVLPRLHGNQPLIHRFWTHDLLSAAGGELLVALTFLATLKRRLWTHEGPLKVVALTSFLFIAYLSRKHSGGHVNVLIPLIFVIDALATEALVRLINRPLTWRWNGRNPRSVLVALTIFTLTIPASRRTWSLRSMRVDPSSKLFHQKFVELARLHRVHTSRSPIIDLQMGRWDPARPEVETVWDRYRIGDTAYPDWIDQDLPVPIRTAEIDLISERADFFVLDRLNLEPSKLREPNLTFVTKKAICDHYQLIGEIAYPNERTLAMGWDRPRYVFARKLQWSRLREQFEAVMPLTQIVDPAAAVYCFPISAQHKDVSPTLLNHNKSSQRSDSVSQPR